MTSEVINELERLINYPDERSINKYNTKFHLLIAQTSGNNRLYKHIKQILIPLQKLQKIWI